MSDHRATVPAKCLSCEADLATPIVCTGCRTLYPMPVSMDYFALLGLPRRFDIRTDKLKDAFRAMARRIHPDRFTDQSQEARALSVQLSAQLNQAVEILKDPVQRANYMLQLAGGPGPTEARDVPGDLLGEVMMFREEIEEARDSKNDAELTRLHDVLSDRREQTLIAVAQRADQLFGCDDTGKLEFRKLINSVKYFDRLLADCTADPLSAASGDDDG